ncbi:unnamed protein product [Boreogadus saida]
MLEAEARGAAIMAIVRLKEGHTGATHMSHQQNTGRGSTAFSRKLSSSSYKRWKGADTLPHPQAPLEAVYHRFSTDGASKNIGAD